LEWPGEGRVVLLGNAQRQTRVRHALQLLYGPGSQRFRKIVGGVKGPFTKMVKGDPDAIPPYLRRQKTVEKNEQEKNGPKGGVGKGGKIFPIGRAKT